MRSCSAAKHGQPWYVTSVVEPKECRHEPCSLPRRGLFSAIWRILSHMADVVKWIAQVDSITAAQCRAGRALVGWSIAELAERARVGARTVTRLERGETGTTLNNTSAIIAALKSAGVSFESSDDKKLRVTLDMNIAKSNNTDVTQP